MTAEIELGDEIPVALYRLYAADGSLLYVGVTHALKARFDTHKAEKSWWPQVARRTVTWHDSRSGALKAEAIAIRDEHPAHNILNPLAPAVTRAIRAARTPQKPRTRSTGRNKTPLVGWHSSDSTMKPWIEDEAARQGVTIRELLDEVIGAYRADLAELRTLHAA